MAKLERTNAAPVSVRIAYVRGGEVEPTVDQIKLIARDRGLEASGPLFVDFTTAPGEPLTIEIASVRQTFEEILELLD